MSKDESKSANMAHNPSFSIESDKQLGQMSIDRTSKKGLILEEFRKGGMQPEMAISYDKFFEFLVRRLGPGFFGETEKKNLADAFYRTDTNQAKQVVVYFIELYNSQI